MPSTFTTNNRLEKQAPGENQDSWEGVGVEPARCAALISLRHHEVGEIGQDRRNEQRNDL